MAASRRRHYQLYLYLGQPNRDLLIVCLGGARDVITMSRYADEWIQNNKQYVTNGVRVWLELWANGTLLEEWEIK